MNYDSICLSGGGIKGISFLGVLKYLNNIDFINVSNINNWFGVSVGGLIAFLFIIGYNHDELTDFILNFDLLKLDNDNSFDLLFNNYGLNNGDKIIYLLSYFLKNKLNKDDITFIDLYNLYNKKLNIVGTNYTTCSEELFNYINTPNMSIITAIRITISIPIYFTPVFYNNNYYIDGGFMNNFPIKYCNTNSTLGIYIKNNTNNFNSIFDFIFGCVNIINISITTKDIYKNNVNIIEINHLSHSLFNLNVSYKSKNDLLLLGEKIAKKYITNINYIICSNILNDIIDSIL